MNFQDQESAKRISREINSNAHAVSIESLLKTLETSIESGLSDEKAKYLLTLYGSNRCDPPKTRSNAKKLFKALFSGMSLFMLIGALLCIVTYIIEIFTNSSSESENLYLAIILIIIVIVSTVLGFVYELKSSKLLESFDKLLPQETLVLREYRSLYIKSENLVKGDIVQLNAGDMVPADIRVVKSNSVKVDNSSLTGESRPKLRQPGVSSDRYIDATNMVFAYTFVAEGSCLGVVVSTGNNTVMGRIAQMVASVKVERSTLSTEIHRFIKIVTYLAFFIGIICFILSLTLTKSSLLSSFIFFIGIIVSNVPEGILLTVTLCLALTAKRMYRKKCVIKNLESIETLGSTSVICSDKTGTLTQNKMLASHLWYNNKIFTVEQPNNKICSEEQALPFTEKCLYNICILCNSARLKENQDMIKPVNNLIMFGNPTDVALLRLGLLNYCSDTILRGMYDKIFEIPFNFYNKFQCAIYKNKQTGKYHILMKGAPERVIKYCDRHLLHGEIVDINQEYLKEQQRVYEKLAGMGERLIGLAYKIVTEPEYSTINFENLKNREIEDSALKFVFVGMVSLIDPPRPGVPKAIGDCRSAGIRVIMITGDHPLTATQIALNIGIFKKKPKTFDELKSHLKSGYSSNRLDSAIINGDELLQMNQEELIILLKNYYELVFARTTPTQKLMIVECLQKIGSIVSVTGDGVNDTPALRQANVGIAMGITGTDAAQKASDIILIDDNFSSIVAGIQEGRLIFDNLKKSVAYILTSSVPELLPFILSIIFKIPVPVGTLTIICIDMTTDFIPALSLAYEKGETDLMSRKPRDVNKNKLVGWTMIKFTYLIVGCLQAVCALFSYVFIMMDNGFFWKDLLVGSRWESREVLYITDSYGQEWSHEARINLLYQAHSIYYLSIVIIQCADLIICKTRFMSILSHQIFGNKLLIISMFLQVILSLTFVYVPYMNTILKTRPIHPKYLVPAIIYSMILWALDELRRWINRKYPISFLARETNY